MTALSIFTGTQKLKFLRVKEQSSGFAIVDCDRPGDTVDMI